MKVLQAEKAEEQQRLKKPANPYKESPKQCR
jgi:hypothetical protein